MRYSRIGLWVVAAAVAVGVTTTVVATATGAAGGEVLSEDGVAGALAAAQQAPAAPAPVGRSDASAASETYRAGDEKLLQTVGGDIVASCDADVLTIHSVAPKPGYRMLMVAIDKMAKALRWSRAVAPPADGAVWLKLGPTGTFAVVFDKASSEVSLKVAVTCVDGEPVAKESDIVKNYGAGKG
jgi:hypothetical protein